MKNKAQSLGEYILVLTITGAVFLSMSAAFRRITQRVVKDVADVIGFQSDAEQASDPQKGYLAESATLTQMTTQAKTLQGEDFHRVSDEQTVKTEMTSKTSMGAP